MTEPAVRASDAERERAVALLRRHSVDGRLTLEEFADRVAAAYRARTRDELDELTHDLPAETAATPAPARKASKWIVTVMGGVNRRGRFRQPARMNVVAIMGGAHIDLRQAELEEPDVTITVVSVMGGASIIVPEGVDVELTGFALMGGKDYRPGSQSTPRGAPLARIRAWSIMGGVSVITKRSPE